MNIEITENGGEYKENISVTKDYALYITPQINKVVSIDYEGDIYVGDEKTGNILEILKNKPL